MPTDQHKPGRVAVLLGGLSSERPISFKSGHAVAAALASRGHDVVEIDVGRDIAERLRQEGIAVAFPVLHGKWGEDGSIQGLLECMGIPYAGPSVFAAALTMDKEATLRMLRGAGLPVPAGVAVRRGQPLPEPPPGPWVVKPVKEGSSFGVTFVDDRAALPAAVSAALALDDVALIEERIDGPELTVGVLEGKALPVVEIAPKEGWFDFGAKYTRGKTEYHVPARIDAALTAEVQRIAEAAAAITGCTDACRVDFMGGGARGPRALEVNTIPGMTDTSLLPMAAACAGIPFAELCERLLGRARLRNGEPVAR